MSVDIEHALQVAISHHRQGDLHAAINAYEQLLEHAPGHLAALTNLASALKSAGRLEEASTRFRQALSLDDSLAALWFNYANLQRDQGNREAAVAAYRKALSLDDNLAAAWFNLANLLRDDEQLDEAERCYRHALQRNPGLARCWMNLGNLLRRTGRLEEALEAHRQAIIAAPDDADAHYNLGNALVEAESHQEAADHYTEALRRRPDHQRALLALGMAQYHLRHIPQALACWQRLVKIQPDHLKAQLNLGSLYREMGQVEQALRHYRAALALAPDDPSIPVSLASTLLDVGHLDEALTLLEPLRESHPDYPELWKSLGNTYAQEARIDEALDCYRRALGLLPADRSVASNLLFSSLYRDWPEPSGITDLHRQIGADMATHAGAAFSIVRRAGDGPLRVGYLTADMRAHPVGFFMEPVFAHHDPQAVAVSCYSLGAKQDELSTRLRQHIPHWVDVHGWSDTRLGEQIITDKIDILVDLLGHTASNRPWLLIRRPAPIQLMYLGYPCTSGLPAMDYVIGDPVLSPVEYQTLYTERVINLAGCFVCFRAPPDAPPVAAAPHLNNGVVTFGSFNHLPKLSLRVRDLWSRILLAVADSRLVLKALAFADPGVRKRLLADFQRRGIDPARITLLPPSTPLSVHLSDYARLDIGLDPLPYTASTTTCQALWMGVPVITLAGQHFHQRMGASVLHHVGLDELVAQDEDDYLARAVALATDRQKLTRVRMGLRERLRTSALCDEAGFTRGLEACYRQLWQDCALPRVDIKTP